MRCLSRMGLGLVGLALIVPTAAWADPPYADPADASSVPRAKPKKAAPKSVFHRARLCAHCHWEDLRKKGVQVPPPPLIPQNAGLSTAGKPCDRCGATVVAIGPANGRSSSNVVVAAATAPPGMSAAMPMPPAPSMPPPGGMAMGSASNCVQCVASNEPPGYAVSGGAPGYDVVGGGDPMPIGMVQGRYANPNPAGPGMGMNGATAMGGMGMPMPGGRPGQVDPSVMPTSLSSSPYLPDDHRHPYILAHLFGLDALGARHRRDRERQAREEHAAISYQPQTGPVSELPSSMVYGGR